LRQMLPPASAYVLQARELMMLGKKGYLDDGLTCTGVAVRPKMRGCKCRGVLAMKCLISME